MSCGFAQSNYLPNELIVKFKPGAELTEIPQRWITRLGVQTMEPVFPSALPYELQDEQMLEMARIYRLLVNGAMPILKVVRALNQEKIVRYAEPKYIGELAYTPNDPALINQNALKLISAEKAWDISKGNTNVWVALLDAGVDTGHVDLKGQFVVNPSDPKNGLDDDNDGFVDNYKGWNFSKKNDNIQFNDIDHGVQMAGLIAASTDNAIGIAGAGFNCKILPITVTNGTSTVVYGYEGIKYAADKGCKIISCSWNIKSYSQFGEDVVNYATSKGALVVAAMGNQGRQDQNYPAQFKNVLAVSNTDLSDNRVSSSNIGYYADLSAPGLNVVTTFPPNTYKRNSGTSMSCAIVAGAAALVATQQPTYTPEEIKAVLKAGTDPLYQNGKNGFYKNKLGVGRLNMFKTLTYTGSWLELDSLFIRDKAAGAVEQNDSALITVWLSNSLNSGGPFTVKIRDLSGYATPIDSVWIIPTVTKGQKIDNTAKPFQIKMDSSIPLNETIALELVIESATDTVTQGFSLTANPTYRTLHANKINTTIGSRGTIGYYLYPQKLGNGVHYNGGGQLLYESGVMIGQGSVGNSIVVDRIRGIRDVEQTDFRSIDALIPVNIPNAVAAFQSTFDDGNAKQPIGVAVKQIASAYNDIGHDEYIVLDYQVYSPTRQYLSQIYVGLLADWEIANFEENHADYNGKKYLAYTYSDVSGSEVAGIQLLSSKQHWNAYAIDHIRDGAGGVDITDNDVFSKEEKFVTLSTTREQAGLTGKGNDVIQILSSGPHDIAVDDTLKVKFALHVSSSLDNLFNNADSAYFRVNNELPNGIKEGEQSMVFELFPNPNEGVFRVRGNLMNEHWRLFNALGKEVVYEKNPISEQEHQIRILRPQTGFYYLKNSSGVVQKVVVH